MLKTIPFLILFLSTELLSQSVKLSESELPSLIATRNGRVQNAVQGIEASKSQLGHLKRSFLPSLQVDLGYESANGYPEGSPNTFGYGSALASVNVYNGGRDLLKDKVLAAGLVKAEAELADSKFDLLTLARSLYWRMVYQKEVIAVLETAMKLNRKNLQAAQKKIINNLATSTDEIDFDQTKIQFNQDVQKAKILLVNNMRQMAALLHHPADTYYEVPDSIAHNPDHPLDEFAKQFEAKNHREVKSLHALHLAQELESEIASRWWAPQLNLYGQKAKSFKTLKEESDIGQDLGEVLGVKLTFFFDGFQSQVSSVADRYRARGLFHLKHQINHEIQNAYKNSYQLYQLNHDLVHSAEENNKLAQRYYDNVWKEYVRGLKNSPDVLQAFQRVVQAKLRYAEIKRDYQEARAEILGFLQE